MRTSQNINITSEAQPSLEMEKIQVEPKRQFISKTTIAGRRLENHQSVKEELKTSATIGYWLVPSKTIIGLTLDITIESLCWP